jgi:hypothetical protein
MLEIIDIRKRGGRRQKRGINWSQGHKLNCLSNQKRRALGVHERMFLQNPILGAQKIKKIDFGIPVSPEGERIVHQEER